MASSWSSGLRRVVGAAAMLLAVSPAFAQWTGKGQLGVALSTGNSESLNANAKVAARHVAGDWEQNIGFTGVYQSDDDATRTQLWEVDGDGRYNFNARDFWFGGARYQEDRFNGFRYQGSVSTGVGRRFIDTDATKLTGRIGAGFKFSETREAFDPVSGQVIPGETENSLAGVAGVDWEHKLNDTTTLYDYFYAEAASQNTFLRNELGLAVAMTSRLALAVAYTVRHNTDPPAGFDRTETLLTVNIVYEVK